MDHLTWEGFHGNKGRDSSIIGSGSTIHLFCLLVALSTYPANDIASEVLAACQVGPTRLTGVPLLVWRHRTVRRPVISSERLSYRSDREPICCWAYL